jgi:hypothetical protein
MLGRSWVEPVTEGHRGGPVGHRVPGPSRLPFSSCGDLLRQVDNESREARQSMSILWIILIVVLVLALLGFFSRGYW